jgi:phospholipase A-2-activating protein
LKQFSGHQDVVRSVAMLDDCLATLGDFVSVGNDGYNTVQIIILRLIKTWKLDGDCTRTIQAHDSFIYTVKVFRGHIFTAGEDRTIKIWRLSGDDIYCVQSISIPALSIWSLCVTPTGNIICGSSDGRIYVFSPQEGLSPDPTMLSSFQQRLNTMQMSKEVLSGSACSSSNVLSGPGILDKMKI